MHEENSYFSTVWWLMRLLAVKILEAYVNSKDGHF